MTRSLCYFDNAATSWPKPARVVMEVTLALAGQLGNPGRSGHQMAVTAGRLVLEARETLAALLGVADPAQIVFTKNATESLNLAIFGLVRPGDHVITSSVEHNAVMRPLRYLETQGVALTVLRCSPEGLLDPAEVRRTMRPDTRLVVTAHASNVLGTLLPVAEIARICREAEVPYLVDGAQTAGAVPIDVEQMGVDLLAFTGHKGLLGPTGTGGLYVREGLELQPLVLGGTGSLSDQEIQPEFLPDRYESGTLNVAGLAGLKAGVSYLLEAGVDKVREHETALVRAFDSLAVCVPGCTIYGPRDPSLRVGMASFNLEGIPPSEVGRLLDTEFGIMSRIGLHCAPSAHRTMGTFPDGAVRFSWGMFNTEDEISYAAEALGRLASLARAGAYRS
ncbi:MAG: aminotransferase class V-fold PLP-dependent enzyme [Chloroflexi bacterium]|nr:aminotransferase class V-fold PLP-dependent enzyme [Chloroflexota bacterium]